MNEDRSMHVGRSCYGPGPLEEDCPCTKAPCGLAVQESAPGCPQHGFAAGRTIRTGHSASECPTARPSEPDEPGEIKPTTDPIRLAWAEIEAMPHALLRIARDALREAFVAGAMWGYATPQSAALALLDGRAEAERRYP